MATVCDPSPVLIVEDEVMIALYLKDLLLQAGLSVQGVARSAAQALALAQTVRPAAAVVDIRLGPGPDGISVAEALLEAYGCRVVFLSGSGERETVERAGAVPGSVFLQKPVNPQVLVDRVQAALAAA